TSCRWTRPWRGTLSGPCGVRRVASKAPTGRPDFSRSTRTRCERGCENWDWIGGSIAHGVPEPPEKNVSPPRRGARFQRAPRRGGETGRAAGLCGSHGAAADGHLIHHHAAGAAALHHRVEVVAAAGEHRGALLVARGAGHAAAVLGHLALAHAHAQV